MLSHALTLSTDSMTQVKKPFENIVGKGENVDNLHYLLFPTKSSALEKKSMYFSHIKFVVCQVFEFGKVQRFG